MWKNLWKTLTPFSADQNSLVTHRPHPHPHNCGPNYLSVTTYESFKKFIAIVKKKHIHLFWFNWH